MNKQTIIDALRAFIWQRPGFESGNYESWRDYRNESREATRAGHEAAGLLRYIELRDSITAADILRAAETGRLSIDAETGVIDYCTGQYFCVEFRPAVARLCASIIWEWLRDSLAPLAPDRASLRNQFVRDLGKRYARYFS